MQPFELRDDRVVLAVPTADDIDRITEICQDGEIQRWTTIPSPYSRSDAEFYVEQHVPKGWAEERDLIWAVREPDDRRVVGMINLRIEAGRGEVGFMLADDARGSGRMSRAVRLVAQYAFSTEGLGLSHLLWQATVGNWASRRVAWATGFRLEGSVRGGLPRRGGGRRDAWVATLAAGDPLTPSVPWLETPTLTGERTMLRPFTESDADAVVEAANDPVSQHWLGGLPSPYTRETALAYIHDRAEEAAAARGVHWAAAPMAGGSATGSFSLMGLQAHDGGAEIGYWVHPAVRGTGVATDAVRLMIAHAFASKSAGGLGLRRLTVAHATGNDASRKVIERAGFRPFGVERAGERLRNGAIVDLHWYDLLTDDVSE